MASISVDGLSVALGEPSRNVLNNVSFTAGEGSITLILGANGSGKSVLLRTILGLHRTSSGTVAIDGKPLDSRNTADLHRRGGVTFQNTDLQIFGDTVESDLRIGSRDTTPFDGSFLAAFGLKDLLSKAPHELSGGQRRRLALAGAFIGTPDFLFLDEPFLELDYPHISLLLEQIRIAKDLGCVILIASHETRDIWKIADQVLLLQNGTVCRFGPPRAVAPAIGQSVGLRPLTTEERAW